MKKARYAYGRQVIPSEKPRYGYARQMARKVLKSLTIAEPFVDVINILERKGYEYLEVETFMDGVDALIVGQYAAVNANHSVQRQRFSLAHELGHKELKHDIDYYKSDITIDNPPKETAHAGYEDSFEKEANAFAGELLVPLEMLKKAFKKTPDIPKLAEIFWVSESVISIAISNHSRSLL